MDFVIVLIVLLLLFGGGGGLYWGDGRWMGNRPHRINCCRSNNCISLAWLSRKATLIGLQVAHSRAI
jgi:hypothetical protein